MKLFEVFDTVKAPDDLYRVFRYILGGIAIPKTKFKERRKSNG